MKQIDNRGTFHSSSAAFRVSAALVAVLISWHLSLAQEGAAQVPSPAPTDAVKVSGRKLNVEGRSPTKQGAVYARYAALLDAYGDLLIYGLENGMFPGGWGSTEDGFRVYRADEERPVPDLVSWLSRSKVMGESDDEGEKILKVQSPEIGSIATARPELRAMTTQDVDGDGLSDVVGVGYDGCVYIMKRPSEGESTVAARSQSFAVVELISGPGYEKMRTVLPQDVGSVEVVKPGLARVLLELEMLESVNGKLMGRATERREVLLPMSGTLGQIRFDINEPPDFARLFDSNVEIRGTAISEKLLEDVEIIHNGTVAWASPEGIGIRALKFNLARDLEPGWNSFRIAARDSEGHTQLREVWVEGPNSLVKSDPKARRAVIVALDDKLNEGKLTEALVKAGFRRDLITVLEEQEATRGAFLQAVSNSGGAGELLLYCETQTVPGSLVGGKTLRLADGQVEASELADAMDAAGYRKSLGVIYSELPKAQRDEADSMALWRDTSTFLDRLGGAGRLFIANVENIEESTKSARNHSRDRLLDAIREGKGSDLARLLDIEKPRNTLFRGWMYGAPILETRAAAVEKS